jgi:hypothetical protein
VESLRQSRSILPSLLARVSLMQRLTAERDARDVSVPHKGAGRRSTEELHGLIDARRAGFLTASAKNDALPDSHIFPGWTVFRGGFQ